jgi:hypothetical protein
MLGLTVLNFLSAATGMAVLALFIRGIALHSVKTLGNFWVDLTRSTLYILLPLAFALALVLDSQGVIQNFSASVLVPPVEQQSCWRESAQLSVIGSRSNKKLFSISGHSLWIWRRVSSRKRVSLSNLPPLSTPCSRSSCATQAKFLLTDSSSSKSGVPPSRRRRSTHGFMSLNSARNWKTIRANRDC